MSDISASPSTRLLALAEGRRPRSAGQTKLGRTTIGPEDVDGGRPAPSAALSGDTSYWEVDHAQYGPVTEEPMSRFARSPPATWRRPRR
jgi:hypothetical protein